MSVSPEPRLAPIPVDEWSDEARATLEEHMPRAAKQFLSGAPDAPRVPNVLGVLMNHPQVAGPWLTYNGVLLNEGTLDPRQRELMILRVAAHTRSEYEWLQHVRLGRQLGITDEELAAIASGGDALVWSALDRLLVAATDQLISGYAINDETWASLREHLDDRQLVEIVFVVGSYICLALAFNTFGLQLDPDLDPSEAPALPRLGE